MFHGATGALHRYVMELNMLCILWTFPTLPDKTFGTICHEFIVLFWPIRQGELQITKPTTSEFYIKCKTLITKF